MSKRYTLLVADDDVLVRIALAEYLRACGHNVIEAANVDEAKTVIQSGPEMSVVLACAQLAGGEGGFGLAQCVRRHRPYARVLLSGSLVKKIQAVESLCGGDGPCPGDILLQRIQAGQSKRRGPKLPNQVRNRRSK